MKKISCTMLLISLLMPGMFAQAGATETIKIAAIFAKTGVATKDNAPNFQGVSLAVEEINSQGGLLGRQLVVIELDNRSSLIDSKRAALKAVELDVAAVIGAAWSSHSLVIAPVLQQKKIPLQVKLANGDYEHLSHLKQIRKRLRTRYFLIEYDDDFQEAMENLDDWLISIEFTGEDGILYAFQTKDSDVSRGMIWMKFPETVQYLPVLWMLLSNPEEPQDAGSAGQGCIHQLGGRR